MLEPPADYLGPLFARLHTSPVQKRVNALVMGSEGTSSESRDIWGKGVDVTIATIIDNMFQASANVRRTLVMKGALSPLLATITRHANPRVLCLCLSAIQALLRDDVPEVQRPERTYQEEMFSIDPKVFVNVEKLQQAKSDDVYTMARDTLLLIGGEYE
eukprot:TRINITY_DN10950_c0_g1_i1.p2 TRINITY_DN10950_c0_g1~~TRINITY_DN10950_c0_g1_i1.p2  ORF type:complete len:159 (-),score=24.91 TRINITY_DN10950_c0_g1_i1:15-491(-)